MADQYEPKAVSTGDPGTSPCRALVVVDPRPASVGQDRPQADFLTQLIACKRRAPAYRIARTAEPANAANAYAAAARLAPALFNRVV